MFGDRRDHVQSDRLYGWATITSVTAVAPNVWSRWVGIEAHSNEAVEGVDQGHSIRATLPRGVSHVSNVCHIGSELHDYRNGRNLLHPHRDHGRVLRYLSHSSAHAALRHAM